MKQRIKIEHIQSGKEWVGKWREEPIVAVNSLLDLEDKSTILIICENGEVGIPALIWNQSVRTIEYLKDETN